MYRAPDEATRQLAASFVDWGIPTADSILNVRKASPRMNIFASGGLKDGLDIAKCIVLGATLGGFAGQFLKAAAISTKKVAELIRITQHQIQVVMFGAGTVDLEALRKIRLKESSGFPGFRQ